MVAITLARVLLAPLVAIAVAMLVLGWRNIYDVCVRAANIICEFIYIHSIDVVRRFFWFIVEHFEAYPMRAIFAACVYVRLFDATASFLWFCRLFYLLWVLMTAAFALLNPPPREWFFLPETGAVRVAWLALVFVASIGFMFAMSSTLHARKFAKSSTVMFLLALFAIGFAGAMCYPRYLVEFPVEAIPTPRRPMNHYHHCHFTLPPCDDVETPRALGRTRAPAANVCGRHARPTLVRRTRAERGDRGSARIPHAPPSISRRHHVQPRRSLDGASAPRHSGDGGAHAADGRRRLA